jgi:mono/diheme cytochrome c family protein
MSRATWLQISLAVLLAIAALFVIMRRAGGESLGPDRVAAGQRLAEAWCKSCHAIQPHMGGMMSDQAPSFTAIANRHGTTALSIKVFLKTSHANMPNIVIAPDQADDLAEFILSLRTN